MESVLKTIDGVLSADASFIKGEAVVDYDPAKITPRMLVDSINKKTFYRASMVPQEANFLQGTKELIIEVGNDPNRLYNIRAIGMELKRVKGVRDVNVLEDFRVSIKYDPKTITPEVIFEVLAKMGIKTLLRRANHGHGFTKL